MNICYVNPTNNIRRPIAELSNILASRGHNITVMFPKSNACPTKNWVANDAIRKGNIKLVPIKSWYFAPLRYNIPNIFQLWKEANKIYKNNDNVHIWEYYYPLSVIPLLTTLFNKKKKRKTILTTDGFVGYSYKPKEPRWLVPTFKLYTQAIAKFLFKIPKLMTTYGNPMLPHAKSAGVQMEKLKVLSTGIHLGKFDSIDKKEVQKLKKEFDIKNEIIILYVGMLTKRKGIDKVIKISQRLLSEGHNIKTILVGDAHGENIYERKVRPEFKESIIFTGGRKEIPEFMKLSHLLLLPSDGEGLPGVVMESMAAGLPVVATHEGCTPDLIESGKEGFLLRIGDLNGYYRSVKQLVESKETRKKFSVNARNKIENFCWIKVSEKYLDLYR